MQKSQTHPSSETFHASTSPYLSTSSPPLTPNLSEGHPPPTPKIKKHAPPPQPRFNNSHITFKYSQMAPKVTLVSEHPLDSIPVFHSSFSLPSFTLIFHAEQVAIYQTLRSSWDEPKNISLPVTGVKLCKLFPYPLRNVKPPGDTSPEVSAPLWRPSK